MSRRRLAIIAALSTALSLTACGGGGGTTAESVASGPPVATATQPGSDSTTAPTATQPAAPASTAPAPASLDPKLLEDFANGFASESDPDTMRGEALSLTVPGSVAYAYVSHLANVSESALDGGNPYSDSQVDEVKDASFKLCDDPSDEDTCSTFTDFKVDASGKIVDMRVNGKTISDRLTVGNGQSVSSKGSKFKFLTAYKSITSNSLFVTVKIESGSKPISPNIYSASYRSPEGKQREATDAFGPTDLDANSNSIVTMVFKGVTAGGKVTLDGCVGKDCTAVFNASMKVGR